MVDIYIRDLDEETYMRLKVVKYQLRCRTWRELFENLIIKLDTSRETGK
jgi:hypothetical protein